MNQKLLLLSIAVMLVPGMVHAQYQRQVNLGGGFVLNTKTYKELDWKSVQPSYDKDNMIPVSALRLPKPLPKQEEVASVPNRAEDTQALPASHILALHAKEQMLKGLDPKHMPAATLDQNQLSAHKNTKKKKELSLKDVSRFAKRHSKMLKNIAQKRKLNQNLSNEEMATWFQFEQMRADVSNQESPALLEKGFPRAALKRLGVSFSQKDKAQREKYEAQASQRKVENQKIQNYNLTTNPTLN